MCRGDFGVMLERQNAVPRDILRGRASRRGMTTGLRLRQVAQNDLTVAITRAIRAGGGPGQPCRGRRARDRSAAIPGSAQSETNRFAARPRGPAGRRRRGRSSPRGLRSATNGVLSSPGFRDRGFGDCCCRLGRPVAYYDGTPKIVHEPYLPAIRDGSVEPLPDRPGPRAQFERRRHEFLPRDLTRLHAAARYTM
jgi:hypothetical protein